MRHGRHGRGRRQGRVGLQHRLHGRLLVGPRRPVADLGADGSAAGADAFEQAMTEGRLLGWAGVRCASLDRLPLCGALPDPAALEAEKARPDRRRWRPGPADTPRLPGLFTLCALGSRGLTLAAWCAQRLAEQMDNAAVQAEPDLWAAVDPARFAWRQGRRATA